MLSALDRLKSGQTDRADQVLLLPLLEALWEARLTDLPAATSAALPAADALGPALVERGITSSAALRTLFQQGRALIELGEEGGELDPAQARHLAGWVDEAAIRLAASVESARRARRQAWLSFLVHELKNPLNTVLNALWLLREKAADSRQSNRFIELAERAVRRLESRVREVRELDEQLVDPPSGWEQRR
jgi:signal transduction histidine kinase